MEMIKFENQEVLIFVLPVILLGILYLYFVKKNRFDFTVYLFVLTFLIISLSNPYIFHGEKAVYKKDAEFIILLDTSLSMAVDDIKPSRFYAAIEKIKKLVKDLKGEKAGILIFSDNPHIVSYPTFNNNELIKKLTELNISPEGSTNLMEAISTAISMLTAKERVIILISDGGDEDIEKLKNLILSSGVRFVFYGIGTEKGGKVPGYNAISKLNKNLKEIALKSGGIFVRYSKSDTDIKMIKQYIKEISKRAEKMALKIKEKFYLTPFIAIAAMGAIFIKFLTKRIFVSMMLLIFLSTHAHAGQLKGYFYYLIGDYIKASKEFEEEKDPRNKYNAAVSMIKAGLYDKAIGILKDIKTENIELLKKVKYSLALCYIAKENYKKAHRLAQELVEYFPEDEKIIKLYRFTNMVENLEKKPEKRKTVVKVKEKKSKHFKKSPMEVGERNPW